MAEFGWISQVVKAKYSLVASCSLQKKKKWRKTYSFRTGWKAESVLMLRCEADRVRDSTLAKLSCRGTCPLPVQKWQAGHWEWVWWQLPPPSALCHDASSQVRQSLQTAQQHVISSRSTEQLAGFKCGVATARGISVFIALKVLLRVWGTSRRRKWWCCQQWTVCTTERYLCLKSFAPRHWDQICAVNVFPERAEWQRLLWEKCSVLITWDLRPKPNLCLCL